jgi:hypothetical protein
MDVALPRAQGHKEDGVFLYIDGDRSVDPATEDLVRALPARYDLAW